MASKWSKCEACGNVDRLEQPDGGGYAACSNCDGGAAMALAPAQAAACEAVDEARLAADRLVTLCDDWLLRAADSTAESASVQASQAQALGALLRWAAANMRHQLRST